VIRDEFGGLIGMWCAPQPEIAASDLGDSQS
jgi:hypothetical protein